MLQAGDFKEIFDYPEIASLMDSDPKTTAESVDTSLNSVRCISRCRIYWEGCNRCLKWFFSAVGKAPVLASC